MKSLKQKINENHINEANDLVTAVENAIKKASNLMNVGKELDKISQKYKFTTNDPPMPAAMYSLTIGNKNYAILNKSYVSGADFVHGEIAFGEM